MGEYQKKTSPAVIFAACGALLFLSVSFFLGGGDSKEIDARYAAIAEIKAGLNDPDSFELISEHSGRGKDGMYYVIIKFRARNGFGGYSVAENRMVINEDGIVLRKY